MGEQLMKHDAFLRVKSDKVSQLLDLVGELGLTAVQVTHHPELAGLELEGFDIAVHRLDLQIRELQDLASSLRLVPVGSVFRRMERLSRDLSHQTGKPIDLVIEGEDIEIDKFLVDQLYDPLVHLVRNAVDHGLESVKERLAVGKPEKGRISLSAVQHGKEIDITVADDGRGLDRATVLQQARKLGLIGPTEEPDDDTVWNYIFHSGLSTSEKVSNLSGRGVGLDVVQTSIRALSGRVIVNNKNRQGTCFTLSIPLTLAFLDGMIVRLQGRLYVIPIDVVSEVFKPESPQVTAVSVDRSEVIRVRGELLPVCRLQQFYGEDGDSISLTEQIVVVRVGHGRCGNKTYCWGGRQVS